MQRERLVERRLAFGRREPQDRGFQSGESPVPESQDREPQYSVTMNVPSSSSNTTTPVQSQPSTEPWQTVTSP